MEPWRGERGKGKLTAETAEGDRNSGNLTKRGCLCVRCIVYVQCKGYTQQSIVWCCVQHWDWEKGHKKDWQLGGSLLLRRKEEYVMLMMTTEISLMSQGSYSGSSAFQFVSSGKLGWVTSERLSCVNWPLLVFKAWTCNNMNGVSKGTYGPHVRRRPWGSSPH